MVSLTPMELWWWQGRVPEKQPRRLSALVETLHAEAGEAIVVPAATVARWRAVLARIGVRFQSTPLPPLPPAAKARRSRRIVDEVADTERLFWG